MQSALRGDGLNTSAALNLPASHLNFDYRAKLGITLDNYGAPPNTQFIFTE